METSTARIPFRCPNCNRPVYVGDSIRWFDAENGTYQHDECPSARESRNQSPKQQAYLFFLRNAGTSYDPKTQTPRQGKAECARKLAKAERDARALGYTFEWEEDYTDAQASLGDHEYWCDTAKNGYADTCQHEIFTCLMRNSKGICCQSLGAIIDPSREYRRVVEAELALEEVSA